MPEVAFLGRAMSSGTDCPTTAGPIAVINLESARRRCWSRFFQDPLRKGLAKAIVEYERLTGQFIGDLSALDRLETLAHQLAVIQTEPHCKETITKLIDEDFTWKDLLAAEKAGMSAA